MRQDLITERLHSRVRCSGDASPACVVLMGPVQQLFPHGLVGLAIIVSFSSRPLTTAWPTCSEPTVFGEAPTTISCAEG